MRQRPLGTPGRFGLWTRFRFHPRVLVFLATTVVVFYLLREAIPSFIFWHRGRRRAEEDRRVGRAGLEGQSGSG